MSCFWKLKLRFSSNGLISPLQRTLGPNCPKLVFRPQTLNVRALWAGVWNFYHVKLYNTVHKISPCLQILGHFWQSYECLFPEKCKKPFKNLQKSIFWSTKIQYLWNFSVKFEKWAILKSSHHLRAFKWCINQTILIKLQFWSYQPI